jgi:hypothetical protein
MRSGKFLGVRAGLCSNVGFSEGSRVFFRDKSRHLTDLVVFDVKWRIDEALKVVGVIVGFGNVGARVRNDSLTRLPERQQEKVHPRLFCPAQQMDPAIAGIFPDFAKEVSLSWFDSPMAIFELALSFWFLFKGLRPSAVAESAKVSG